MPHTVHTAPHRQISTGKQDIYVSTYHFGRKYKDRLEMNMKTAVLICTSKVVPGTGTRLQQYQSDHQYKEHFDSIFNTQKVPIFRVRMVSLHYTCGYEYIHLPPACPLPLSRSRTLTPVISYSYCCTCLEKLNRPRSCLRPSPTTARRRTGAAQRRCPEERGRLRLVEFCSLIT